MVIQTLDTNDINNFSLSERLCIRAGEPWDPQKSSLAQVINSILFLIFVDEPMFNEPGYEVISN